MKGVGGAYVMITAIVLLLVTLMIYNMFSPVLAGMQAPVASVLNDSGMDQGMAGNATATLDIITNVWKFWPIILIFGVIIWVIGSAARRENVQEAY